MALYLRCTVKTAMSRDEVNVRQRPLIAITIGDAAGVGPEIIVKALLSKRIYSGCYPVVVGESATMSETIRLLDSPLKLHPVSELGRVKGEFGTIDLVDLQNLNRKEVIVGQICRSCGKAAMEYITEAARLALENEVEAVVTAPINKEATIQAGYRDVGHLEFLARITHATEYATMLVSGLLRVVHLTTHHSLRDACQLVTREKIFSRLRLTQDSFQQWGITNPRIGVAALNPHAGEGGLFGSEEVEQILPAVEEAQSLGIDARGPFPADSIFNRAINGEFDVVLAMYHDQGHIPIKVHGFEQSVSVALGLPFIRTSVDHGTAFDIAGKGIADSRSLEEAIIMAVQLCEGKGLPG
ncbi:4-hydroxythreonine-4-phosphate dehydrogenase PdxA [Chloroflexota bacterium]